MKYYIIFSLDIKHSLMTVNVTISSLIFFCFSLSGDLPYRYIPLSSIVAEVVDGYRLPIPEYASEDM